MFRQDFGLRFGVAYICVSMLNEIYCPFLDRSCLFIDFLTVFPCSFSMIGNSHGAVTSGMDVSMLFIPGDNTYLSGGKLPTCSSTGLFL